MCKLKTTVLTAMVAAMAAAAYGGQVGIRITKTAKAPVIDGKLTDACWQNQTPLDNFTLNNLHASPAKKQTKAYICYDDKNIYVAIRCHEPNMARISAGYTESDRDNKFLWGNDCVEVFISRKVGVYYQLLLTAGNALLDIKYNYKTGEDGYVLGGYSEAKSDYSWNCKGVKNAIHKGKDHWSAELSIPLSQIGGATKPGDVWRVNIAREEKQLRELSTFSPLVGMFHQPEAFSRMTFEQDKAVVVRPTRDVPTLDLTPGAKDAHKADKGTKPVIFVKDYMERGYPTTLPRKGQVTDTIEVFASLGEYEPATFCVRATGKALEGVQATVSGDLKSKAGSVIPANNVDIRLVEIWKRRLTTSKRMYMERYLQKKASVDIPMHTTRRFWLTVHVPDSAEGGIYHSRILIVAGQKTLKALNLKVEVLPFKLTSSEGMGYFMYFPQWGIPERCRTPEYLRKIFVDMREHGMTTATLYLFPYGTVNGKRQFTFEARGEGGQLAFGPTMDILRDTKLMKPGMPAIWLGADVVGASEWKKILDEGKKRKWPELVLYLQDEPGDEKRIKNAKRLFRILDGFKKQYPQYSSVRATTAIGSSGIEALGEFYDIWIAGAGFDEKLVRKAREMGKLLWSYDCGLATVDAETTRYYFGLWCWKTGIKGASLWAYSSTQNTSEHRWDYIEKNLENFELTFSFVWPAADGPIPSIGWEAAREGIDDHKYVSTLTRMIEKAKAAGHTEAARQAEATLKQITDKIRVKALDQATRVGSASGWRAGGYYDRPSPQAEIAKGDYNKFRYKIARQIITLQKHLKH